MSLASLRLVPEFLRADGSDRLLRPWFSVSQSSIWRVQT